MSFEDSEENLHVQGVIATGAKVLCSTERITQSNVMKLNKAGVIVVASMFVEKRC
jgi:hypothetical protein